MPELHHIYDKFSEQHQQQSIKKHKKAPYLMTN